MQKTKTDKKPKSGNWRLVPISLIIFILILLIVSNLFVITTLRYALEQNFKEGLNVTFKRYVEHEKLLAADAVGSLVRGMRSAIRSSELPEELLKKELLSMISIGAAAQNTERGYLVIDENNVFLISYDYPAVVGESLNKLKTETNIDLIRKVEELRNGASPEFIEYEIPSFDENSVPRRKVSYLYHLEEYDWIIGAGFHTDGANVFLKEWHIVSQKLRKDINQTVFLKLFFFTAGFFVFLVFVILFLYRFYILKKNLEKEHKEYQKIIEDNLCVIITNTDGSIKRVNDKYLSLSGHSRAELIGEKYYSDFYPDLAEGYVEKIRNTIYDGRIWNGLIKGINVNGFPFWMQAQTGAVKNIDGEIVSYVAFGLDVTELHRQKYELEKSFLYDGLTGLGNRVKMLSDFDMYKTVNVAMYNIDRFSSINRFFGMDKGDEILKEIADRLNLISVSGNFSCYRIHSDTFVILGLKPGEEEFIKFSKRVLKELNEIVIKLNKSNIPISVRCGVSVCKEDTLIIADAALGASKSSPDGFVEYSDAEIGDHVIKMENLEKLSKIRTALNNSDVFLVFQPIMCFKTGEVNKYECLIRMREADGKVINPGNFITIAKEGRIYKKLTFFVIEKSFEVFSKRDEDFSINLILEDFMDNETLDFLLERAAHFDISKRLILEIVETEELKDFNGIVKIIDRLKKRGIRIAIDDFGSGFSNFNYLLQLNADFIKIDGSLIKNILTDKRSFSLVTSIILFAKKSGIETIAEYIEKEELLEFAKQNGINYGQGFFIGKPVENFQNIQ